MSEYNPKNIISVSVAAAGASLAETVIFAPSGMGAGQGACKLIGISYRFNGSAVAGAGGTLTVRDAATTGGGSAAVYQQSVGNSKAAGAGIAWYEDCFGMLFRNGITAAIPIANAAANIQTTFILEVLAT